VTPRATAARSSNSACSLFPFGKPQAHGSSHDRPGLARGVATRPRWYSPIRGPTPVLPGIAKGSFKDRKTGRGKIPIACEVVVQPPLQRGKPAPSLRLMTPLAKVTTTMCCPKAVRH